MIESSGKTKKYAKLGSSEQDEKPEEKEERSEKET